MSAHAGKWLCECTCECTCRKAADKEAVRGRDEGASTDHREVPSVEVEWANGGGSSTGSQAQGEATAMGQSGYLPEGTRVRVVGLSRSSQYNGTLRVVEYTQQSVEGAENERQLIRVAVTIKHGSEERCISVPVHGISAGGRCRGR